MKISGKFTPFIHPTGEVNQVIETKSLFEALNGDLAPDAFLTINDYRFVAWNGINVLKNFIEWDKRSADIKMLMFKRLPNIEQEIIFPGFEFVP